MELHAGAHAAYPTLASLALVFFRYQSTTADPPSMMDLRSAWYVLYIIPAPSTPSYNTSECSHTSPSQRYDTHTSHEAAIFVLPPLDASPPTQHQLPRSPSCRIAWVFCRDFAERAGAGAEADLNLCHIIYTCQSRTEDAIVRPCP